MGLLRWLKHLLIKLDPEPAAPEPKDTGLLTLEPKTESRPLPAAGSRILSHAPLKGKDHLLVRSWRGQDAEETLVRLEGVLNQETADQLEEALVLLLKQGEVNLVIDFSKVPYVSSRAWGTLLSFVQTLRKQGGNIKISGMSPNVTKLFYHTGLSAIFETCTLDPAILFQANAAWQRRATPKLPVVRSALKRKSSNHGPNHHPGQNHQAGVS
jgi:anti-sigma B factor antagonist